MEKIAVFVDLNKENFNFTAFSELISKLEARGQIIYGKLYNFSSTKHKEFLSIVNELDFSCDPQLILGRSKKKDVLDIRQVVDILNLVNSQTKIDTIFVLTGSGNVVPVLKTLKMKNLYVIGAYDYHEKANMDMCNENYTFDGIENVATKKSTKTPAKNKETVKKTAKKTTTKKAVAKKEESAKPASRRKKSAVTKKPVKAAPKEEKVEAAGEEAEIAQVPEKPAQVKKTLKQPAKSASKPSNLAQNEEAFFISVLEDFARRTNELNFDYNEDFDKKIQLLNDIESFVKEQKEIQYEKDEFNPEIMAVLRELGNLATDIKATMDIE